MDEPYCEICGEQHATIKLQDVGACDDCAADVLREALKPAIGNICASISRQRDNGFLQICLAPFGIEHDHGG